MRAARIPLSLPLFVLFVAFCSNLRSETLTGQVVRVIDGDTIVLRPNGPQPDAAVYGPGSTVHGLPIRLAGIDAPELTQPFGPESKRALEQMILGQTVLVDYRRRDRYRRILGWVRREVSGFGFQVSAPDGTPPAILHSPSSINHSRSSHLDPRPSPSPDHWSLITDNFRLVRTGLAWHAPQYCRDPNLAQAQAAARAQQTGLWRSTDAIPPWTFRARRR